MKTFSEDEVYKFSRISNEWWNENGKFKLLHIINPLRVSYIVKYIKENIDRNFNTISLLDLGCGGGILSESMAKLDIVVTGIDVSEENIKIAKMHSEKVGLNILYKHTSVEKLNSDEQYDVILIMEVIEHVEDLTFFIKKTIELLKPRGLLFISTINRTIKSFFLAIVGAEYILNWLPRGTHNWNKFIKPSEIATCFRENNVELKHMAGMSYSIMKDEWALTSDVSVNYLMYGIKDY
ncbi:bifunctional 2-polyprenyl-6-hydroxyphenol methylase/3-demethylubiquinol 3-O-methyltransferase UbiG [Wolbachia endosymbiont of Pentidionis agamae]|uniref:bifunctional 2-polyprenyl-6-hydroxyphenol methylase/3-demethylubiquinol 3-O-methyltransferase UbiG n=1 Tax=Wolbachia endosymbiont of Pentidionis agamae TaxID=3110435 RepID=UPI002FD5AC5D